MFNLILRQYAFPILLTKESSHLRCSVKKGVPEIIRITYGYSDDFRGHRSTCNFVKKETLAQVFSCEFCEISKNTFFTEYLRTTASIKMNFTEVTELIVSKFQL